MDTKSVDFVLLKVKANNKPPKNVNTNTRVLLKKMCPKENTIAFIKINRLLFLKMLW